MTNSRVVCLLLVAFFCSDVSFARQLPKECSKGPDYWCQSLKQASDCGAVGHCTTTVWETKQVSVSHNEISDNFVKFFRQLKDVKDLINEDYLSTRMAAMCLEAPSPAKDICKENTEHQEQYLSHVLQSAATPETLCKVVGMCDNDKLEAVVDKKKPTGNDKHKETLLGSEKCVWGPSYWCSNITTSHKCKATHHCVQRVWSKMQLPEDTDSICKICTDMVKQARDQLESNETQEELKQVFEGSCNLIPIKLVRSECDKLADEFVPDLVETLASQMNPQAVCSVAGLCNSERLDRMLEDYNAELKKRTECNNCHQTVGVLRKRFDATSYDDFLVGLLKFCRNMGSFSDSCSMLVFKHYETLVAATKHDLRPQGVCHASGQCGHVSHNHGLYEFPADVTEVKETDDVPCEFCEQLVTHLRDVLVANTTGVEFYKILKGLCRQTGSFSEECLHLAEEYYPEIYNYLVSDLKPKEICGLVGVCPKGSDVSVAPLLPRELEIKIADPSRLIGQDERNSEKVLPVPKQTNVRIMGQEAALPIERMFVSLPENKGACAFCEYFLHYLQVELSDIKTENEIKAAVEKACDYLPKSVEPQCKQFVTEYGPAVIALLVQEIDPASICPALGVCPSGVGAGVGVRRVAINSDKSNCPLCLFAVEQLQAVLKNNRTESSIKQALESLCTHLSSKLRSECSDFVDAYSSQLVEMLVADMDAQEICIYLKLCTDNAHHADPLKLSHSSVDKFFENPRLRGDRNSVRKQPVYTLDAAGDIETNMIPDHTANGRPAFVASAKTVCVVCEFVLKEIDDQIKDKHNDDEIKKIVHGVCTHMPKSVKPDCDRFVEKYADLVISLLAQELNADEVCKELKLCPNGQGMKEVKEAVLDCAVCETVVMAVKKVLNNDKADRNIVHIVEKSCNLLPAKYTDRCLTMMEIYGASVIHLIEDVGAKGVCQKIGLCAKQTGARLRFIKNHH